MRLWLLTRRITHLQEKGDRIRGEALHLAPQSCGFRLLRFTLQLQTPKIPHMHFLTQPIQASIPSDFFHSRNWGHPTAAGQSTVALVYVERLFIRRFCEFGFGFWRDAALYDPWRPSFTTRHCDPLFFTLSAVSFLSIFSLLLHSVFLFCRHLLLLIVFLRRSWISFVGLFFHVFFLFSCCVSPCFPFLKSFLFFTQKSVSFMLVLSLPFSFCFDLSTKYLVSC